jgi:hypothetical protein
VEQDKLAAAAAEVVRMARVVMLQKEAQKIMLPKQVLQKVVAKPEEMIAPKQDSAPEAVVVVTAVN